MGTVLRSNIKGRSNIGRQQNVNRKPNSDYLRLEPRQVTEAIMYASSLPAGSANFRMCLDQFDVAPLKAGDMSGPR